MDQTMEGKVAVVTGASRGIGKAIAVKLASKGATVVINYNGSRERAEEVKNEVESAGGKAVIIQCNVADFDACKEFIETVIKEQGRIDILVNNAGITKDGLLMKMSEEDFDKVLDTNLKGTFHTIRAALRQMIRQRSGRIINMASVVGVSGNAGQANYAASKAGVIGLTKTAAREVASRGITVNAIAPGFIETPWHSARTQESYDRINRKIALHRFGTVEEVADMARRSVALNGLEQKITIVNGDIKEASQIFGPASFDVVTSNPPYMNHSGGLKNPHLPKAIARHEVLCTLEDVVREAAKVLKTGGRFYMVHRPHRLAEIINTLTAHRLEPKRLKMVHPFADREANMVMIEAVRSGGSFLKVEAPVIVFQAPGVYSDEIRDVYGY